jgi:P27 family predicted phage terminase small subunit
VPVSLGEEGRHYWDRYWTAASAWLSPDLDHQALESVCHLADEIAEYRRAMADEGLQISEPIVTPTGVVVGDRLVSNPAIKDLRNAEKQLRDWLSDLGFTPTARARLGLAEVRRQSKLEELLAKRAT